MVPGENKQILEVQNMCATSTATSTADEPHATFHVRDTTQNLSLDNAGVKTISLPASTTAWQLMVEVGKLFSYDPETFELIHQRNNVTTFIHDCGSQSLTELGFSCGKGRNVIIICCMKNTRPVKVTQPTVPIPQTFSSIEDLKNHLQDITNTNLTFYPAPPPYTPGTSSSTTTTSTSTSTSYSCSTASDEKSYSYSTPSEDRPYSYSSAVSRQETGFVGLVNQAMTCYLNSLLQTLFMTPEFRNTLYRWEFDGTEEEGTKSIPFQLQKLFLQLQTSSKPAVGTTELTTSFGWDSSEAWQQHDVQELCRVMFDALEQKFKNTRQADLISRLYEGKLKDYVKCLECGYESAREDTFLDVPLVVRPFGSSQAYASVGEALHAFTTPETLEGSNQYFCEHCNKKNDAHKGLKFIKFPYLLTLQLKRFDFDPVTMHRIKLNDRVSFPEILNLNDFIKSDNSPEACDDGDTTDSGSALDDEGIGYASGYKTGCSLSPEAVSDNDLPDDDEGIDVGPHGPPMENNHELCVNERNLKKSMEKGPYVYELFSIMVHSGSANGGHYYAYIKSFKHGEWYCFNDAQVTKITYDDIQKTYGGGPTRGYYSSAYSSSTNAYMLMYRQIDKEKNAECMTLQEFPEHIKALLQCMLEQEERDRIQRELDRSTCKIKLFCQHPVTNRMIEMRLKIHKDCTLAEATQTAHSIIGLKFVPLDCCRLVKYDDLDDSLECSFDPNTEETIGDLLGGVKSNYKFDLLLEIKKPDEVFQEYKPGGVTVKVHVVDMEHERVTGRYVIVRSHPSNTVEELRKQVADALKVEDDTKIRMVLETFCNSFNLLRNPTNTLDCEGFHKSNKLYVEFADAIDAERSFCESKLYHCLDVNAHTICIHLSLPKVDKAIVDRLRLYDCDSPENLEDSSSEDEVEDEAYSKVSGRCTSDSSDSGSERVVRRRTVHSCTRRIEPFGKLTLLEKRGLHEEYRTENQKHMDDLCTQLSFELAKCDQTNKEKTDNSLSKEDIDEGLGDSESASCYSGVRAAGDAASKRTVIRSSDVAIFRVPRSDTEKRSVDWDNMVSVGKDYGFEFSKCDKTNKEKTDNSLSKEDIDEGLGDSESASGYSRARAAGDSVAKRTVKSSSGKAIVKVPRPDTEERSGDVNTLDLDTICKDLLVEVSKRNKKKTDSSSPSKEDIDEGLEDSESANCYSGARAAEDLDARRSAGLKLSDTEERLYLDKKMAFKVAKRNEKKAANISPPKEDIDEGLGDSESVGRHSGAIHSDQSEDSSLTDSERTLVGDEMSPRNNSPDIDRSKKDPFVLLDIDSNSVIVRNTMNQSNNKCSVFSSDLPREQEDTRNMSSPEENTKEPKIFPDTSWRKHNTAPEITYKNYFAAYTYFDSETGEKMLRVYVDKRTTLGELKKELEPFVGVGPECFKIFRVYSKNQEMECTGLTDNLMSFSDDTKLTVKLGRALRKGEYKAKVFLFRVNDPEPIRFLIDCVISKGMLVRDLKSEILPEIKEKCDLDIPFDSCRLRKKNWKNPRHIFLDHRRFDSYPSFLGNNCEIFLEELPGLEPMITPHQISFFTKMWHPSTFTLDPFKEVISDPLESLPQKLSEISQVPEECIEYALGKGTFPCEVSLLSIDEHLNWKSFTFTPPINVNSTYIKEIIETDGDVVYYRDSREELKKLTEEEKRIIMNKENARSNKNLKSTFSPRKEKALKIYTMDSEPSKSEKPAIAPITEFYESYNSSKVFFFKTEPLD